MLASTKPRGTYLFQPAEEGPPDGEEGGAEEILAPDTKGNPVTANDPALTARVVPSLERALGAANVVAMDLIMVAEDFSL